MLYKKSDGTVAYRLGDDVPPGAVVITVAQIQALPDPAAQTQPLLENMEKAIKQSLEAKKNAAYVRPLMPIEKSLLISQGKATLNPDGTLDMVPEKTDETK